MKLGVNRSLFLGYIYVSSSSLGWKSVLWPESVVKYCDLSEDLKSAQTSVISSLILILIILQRSMISQHALTIFKCHWPNKGVCSKNIQPEIPGWMWDAMQRQHHHQLLFSPVSLSADPENAWLLSVMQTNISTVYPVIRILKYIWLNQTWRCDMRLFPVVLMLC